MTGTRLPGATTPDRNGRAVALLIAGVLAAIAIVTKATIQSQLDGPPRASALAEVDARLAIAQGMAALNDAANHGQQPSQALIDRIVSQADAVPLRTEPYLVAAIEADGRGEHARAKRLLMAARARDPRSAPVRYFLAEHFRQQGDLERSLAEVAVLLRLRSDSGPGFASYFASLALDPKSRGAIGGLMRSDPAVGRQILAAMASAGASPDIVFELARQLPRSDDDEAWQRNLVSNAISRGDLDGAYAIWARVAGEGRMPGLINNPAFAHDPAPPPFSWTYSSSPDGVAERNGNGGLSLLYYGRKSAVLAGQLLKLSPGPYRLTWTTADASGNIDAIKWRMICNGQATPVGEVGLATSGLSFVVPDACPFARLELVGEGETQGPVSATLSGLKLDRAQ